MLKIVVPVGDEVYDPKHQLFVKPGEFVLELEHSLAAISKWESIFEKPFLSDKEKTTIEVYAYIRAMTLTPEVPEDIFEQLSQQNLEDINTYIGAKRSATWFNDQEAPKSREVITSELIYYWMATYQIPFECDQWHISRLFTLIKIANLKNAKPKKMSAGEEAARRRALNDQRRREMGTSG